MMIHSLIAMDHFILERIGIILFYYYKALFVISSYYLNYEKDHHKARLNIDSMQSVMKGNIKIYKAEYANTLFSDGDVLLAEKKYTAAFKSYYDGLDFVKKNLEQQIR